MPEKDAAQGGLFSYGDAQRYRLGVNHQHLPVNAPRCPVRSYHRDGTMRVDTQLRRHARLRAEQLWRVAARAMGDAPQEIKLRHIGNCMKADSAYGEGVANALGVPMGEVAGSR